MKVLITRAAGFINTHTAARFGKALRGRREALAMDTGVQEFIHGVTE